MSTVVRRVQYIKPKPDVFAFDSDPLRAECVRLARRVTRTDAEYRGLTKTAVTRARKGGDPFVQVARFVDALDVVAAQQVVVWLQARVTARASREPACIRVLTRQELGHGQHEDSLSMALLDGEPVEQELEQAIEQEIAIEQLRLIALRGKP